MTDGSSRRHRTGGGPHGGGPGGTGQQPALHRGEVLAHALNEEMSAPPKGAAGKTSAFSSGDIPSAGARPSRSRRPTGGRSRDRLPDRGQESRIPLAAVRLPSSGIGCRASTNRTGPAPPPVPRGTAITPEATRSPSAARAARPSYALPSLRRPGRHGRTAPGDAVLRTPGAEKARESPSSRSADVTRCAGSTAADGCPETAATPVPSKLPSWGLRPGRPSRQWERILERNSAGRAPTGRTEEFRLRGVLDDPPVVHEDHAVGHVLANPISWVHDHHRHPLLRQVLHDRARTSPIISGSEEPRSGSSKSIADRVHRKRPGDRHPLLLAAGELAGMLLREILQAHPVEERKRLLRQPPPSSVRAP